MNAKQILRIPETQPEVLFKKDDLKKQYRNLSLQWHPDRNGNDGKVLAHINLLYGVAQKKLDNGKWEIPGEYHCQKLNGTMCIVRYKVKRKFELGEMYISDTVVAYVVDETNRDLFQNAEKVIKSFKYKSKGMEAEFSRYLPKIVQSFRTLDNKRVIVISKTKDLISLRDVLTYLDGTLDAKHVAWVMSCLHNITCYLSYHGITHNDISLDTVFMSPKHHSVALLGGWWYSRPFNEKLIGVTNRTYSLMPMDVKRSKVSEPRVDLELIRAVGRALLGDATGNRLLAMKVAPEPMISWLRLPGTGKAVKDYSKWMESVLMESFGKRRFIKLDVDAERVYKKINNL